MNQKELIRLEGATYLVVGTCRNVERTIEADVKRITNAIPSNKISWLVVESDSADRTLRALSSLREEMPDFRYISEGALANKIADRVERISFCRNKYIKEIKENPIYSNVDYVIVADLDGLNNCISEAYFLTCQSRTDWDVCCANQSEGYYDLFALRHELWNPCDCFLQRDFINQYRHPKYKKSLLEKGLIQSKFIKIPEGSPWIEVDSAFGGLAIYRRDVIASSCYSHLDASNRISCEHVQLHKKIKENGGRIFINPDFVNAKETEHTGHIFKPRLLRLWSRLLRSFLKRRHYITFYRKK